MSPNNILVTSLIVGVSAAAVALAFNDSPFLAFLLVLVLLSGLEVSK